jgi:hypothetical protein
MMKGITGLSVFAALCSSGLFCAVATAQSEPRIIVGQAPKTFAGAASPFSFRIESAQPSSACCTVTDADLDPEITTVNTLDVAHPSSPSFSYRGALSPIIPSHSDMVNLSEKSRVCFMSVNAVSYDFPVQSSTRTPGSSFNELQVACEDTTMFGGFNTVVTELNYLEMINTTGQPISAHIYGFRETTGGEKVIDADVSIPGGAGTPRRVDFDIHSVVGPGAFGTLVITSDAPKGSLNVNVAQYRITSRNPFNFELVARNPVTYRSQ